MHNFSPFLKVLHDITMLFTYFASFIKYEDDILEVISNLHIQGAKLGGKRTNLAENLLKVELCGVHGVCFFPKSELRSELTDQRKVVTELRQVPRKGRTTTGMIVATLMQDIVHGRAQGKEFPILTVSK